MTLGVCWKWISPSGDVPGGVSPADQAALEVALAFADANPGTEVRVVTCGGADAESGLRDALAAGAHDAVRIDGTPEAASVDVARALAPVLVDCEGVVCGDHSLDRGTGSVPAYIAGLTGRPQALGLIEVDTSDPETWRATRRLDGGRRELLTVRLPAVLSVEAPAARLRRASLPSSRAAASAEIPVSPGPRDAAPEALARVTRFAPRARVVPAPAGATALDRIRALTEIGDVAPRGDPVVAEPADAADLIITTLREWGHLPDGV